MLSTQSTPDLVSRAFRRDGFTLVEMIAALVLLGVLTAMVGMGIVAAARSFTFSRDNAQVAQKGQLTMARISRELMELVLIRAVGEDGVGPFIIYERPAGDTQASVGCGLRYHRADNTLRLYTDVSGVTFTGSGNLLSDGVAQFALGYLEGDGPWNSGILNSISSIHIQISLARRDAPNRPHQFSTRVYLRKTPYISGAPAPGSIPEMAVGFLLPLMACLRKRCASLPVPSGKSGNALVVIVIAILVFGVMAAAIIPMVSSSSHQMAVTDASARALDLAESGFRYAESRWDPYDSEAERHIALEALDGTYTLSGDDGEFTLRLESYFLELASDIGGSPTFQAHCPGSLPKDMILAGIQRIRIGDRTVMVSDVQRVSGREDDQLIITLAEPPGYYPGHTPVLLAATVSQVLNGELIYNSPQGEIFPLRNGPVMIGASNEIVTYRFNDRARQRLIGLNNPLDANWTLTANSGDTIVLLPAVRLHSTGRAGGGDLLVERELIHDAPLSMADNLTTRQQITDTTGALFASSLGTHSAAEVDGNTALTVTAPGGGPDALSSLAELNLTADGAIDFGRAKRGTGGYLSYDAQIKVGFYNLGIEAELAALNFSAGLGFRLRRTDADIFMYGLGFMRAGTSDGIPDDLVPSEIANRRAIVLWQQTGQQRQWLAFKKMTDVVAPDNTGGTPQYALPISDSIRLRFTFSCPSEQCTAVKAVLKDGRTLGAPVPTVPTDTIELDLTDYAASNIELAFYYTDLSQPNIDHPADSYVHNVRIEADWPIQNSTLLVRLQEAAALSFTSGGPEAVRKGDWVIGATSGVRGQVAFAPILSSGAWADNDAGGTLQLNRVTGSFQAEELFVIGKGRLARVTPYGDPVNFIKTYYGRSQGNPSGDTDRFNAVMLGNSRMTSGRELNWPPDDAAEWAADTDYFRLIEWDGINPAVADLAFVPWQLEGRFRNRSIIRSHQADVQTPQGDIPAELGLYALGDGAANIYFDDFGLQIDTPVRSPFPPPLRQ